MNPSGKKISPAVVVKYTLLQLPALAVLCLFLYFMTRAEAMSEVTALVIAGLWILKDMVLFPFVRHSYDSSGKGFSNTMIGRKGRAREDLNPSGYVEIAGELWMAELCTDSESAVQGDAVRVVGIRGLTLEVKGWTEESFE